MLVKLNDSASELQFETLGELEFTKETEVHVHDARSAKNVEAAVPKAGLADAGERSLRKEGMVRPDSPQLRHRSHLIGSLRVPGHVQRRIVRTYRERRPADQA